MTRTRALPALLTLLAWLPLACGGDSFEADVPSDVAPDVVPDVAPDVAPDLPPALIADDVTPESLVLPPHPCTGLPDLPDGVRLRAATWNVYGGHWATLDELGAVLADLQADLVGLEECPEGAAATLADLAGFPYSEQLGGQALLSKTPLGGAALVALGSEGRAALRATTAIGGAPFSVYVVHVSWNVAGNVQCRQLADVLAADPADRLVIVGDFNDEPHSTQIATLEPVVADVFTTAGIFPGQLISWPSHWFDETEGSQLIDLIFFRRSFAALVLDVGVAELMPPRSDHKPAWADLLYPAAGADAFATDPLAPRHDPLRALPPEGERPPNLLQNPGAEQGLAGWTVEGDPRAEAFREERTPRTGAAFFTGYPTIAGKIMRSSGTQTVDLSAHAEAIDQRSGRLYASAWLATGYLTVTEGDEVSNLAKPYDDAEVIVQALDAAGQTMIERSSGRRDTLGWVPWAEALDLPPGTRAARITWAMDRKVQSGLGNDGAVDDLYLGYEERAEAHARPGGDLVRDGGADDDEATAWNLGDWRVTPNDTIVGPWGGTVFPPWSWSGAGFFAARAPGLDPLTASPVMAQALDLAPYATALAAGTLALRWGGWLRTYESRTPWTLLLRLDDDQGAWGEVTAAPVFAAAWSPVESLTRIPPGTARATVVLLGPAPSSAVDAGFADSLFAWPEIVAPAPGL